MLSQSGPRPTTTDSSDSDDDDGDEPMLAVVRDEADLPRALRRPVVWRFVARLRDPAERHRPSTPDRQTLPRPTAATQWLRRRVERRGGGAAPEARARDRGRHAPRRRVGAAADGPRPPGRRRRVIDDAPGRPRALRRGVTTGPAARRARGDAGDLLGLLARCYRGAKGDDSLQTDVVSWLRRCSSDNRRARGAGRRGLPASRRRWRVAAIGGAPTGDRRGAFRMLAALFGGRDAVVLSDAKLKAVAASGRAALADGALLDQGTLQSHRAAALQLILALVNKKVVVSEVYDAMDAMRTSQYKSRQVRPDQVRQGIRRFW